MQILSVFDFRASQQMVQIFKSFFFFKPIFPLYRMFYKIKSRNAHMKIHRQPQEDWTDKRLQHQLLTQRLALNRPTNLMPSPGSSLLPPQAAALTFPSSGLAGMSSNNTNADNVLNSVTNSNGITRSNSSVLDPSAMVTYSNIAASNSHVITNIDGGDLNQREPTTVLPFHQSWGSFGHGPDHAIFYCNSEGKDNVGAGTVGGKEPINWQQCLTFPKALLPLRYETHPNCFLILTRLPTWQSEPSVQTSVLFSNIFQENSFIISVCFYFNLCI